LTVQAGHSKHRRTDVIPLRKDFAQRILAWLKTKSRLPPHVPLLAITDKRTAEMLQKDMARARKAWIEKAEDDRERCRREKSSFLLHQDENGCIVDFHALRTTFITNLSRSGVTPKMAQTLARHSDINLTMNIYTRLGVLDQAAAVESLPAIPHMLAATHETERLRVTG
jgi:integrase